MRGIYYCLISLLAMGCKEKGYDHYWVGSHSRLPHDTCYFSQTVTVRNDSVILDCNTGNVFSKLFVFNLKDKSKVFYSGSIGSKHLIYNHDTVRKGAKVIFRYIDDTTIITSGKRYPLCRYFYDEEGAYDVSCNYYWMPEFGIVYFGDPVDYYRMYTTDSETNETIGFAVGVIRKWKSLR